MADGNRYRANVNNFKNASKTFLSKKPTLCNTCCFLRGFTDLTHSDLLVRCTFCALFSLFELCKGKKLYIDMMHSCCFVRGFT